MTNEAKTYNGVKIVYSINSVWKIGEIHAKKKMKLDYLYHIQEQTQNGLKVEMLNFKL